MQNSARLCSSDQLWVPSSVLQAPSSSSTSTSLRMPWQPTLSRPTAPPRGEAGSMRSATSRLENQLALHAFTHSQAGHSIQRRHTLDRQNQFQRLCTEEVLRQQNSLKRCTEREEEEEEEEESSTSTTSSPCLRHKNQRTSRYDSVQLQPHLNKKLL